MAGNADFTSALVGGACAGFCVDLALFPVDTIKTRLQSPQGFIKAGGFKQIYAGLGSTAVGSMPGAALFFCTYEGVKGALTPYAKNDRQMALVHMAAASCGEIAACVVRVPTEVIKQRAQASKQPSFQVLRQTLHSERIAGLYRGYFSTVLREIPFSFIQFPLWESLKRNWSRRQNRPLEAWQSGLCGAVSGGFAAAVTTPLDVAKTRIMLAEKSSSLATGNIIHAINIVFKEKGMRGLFAGIAPRVTWISIGGCIFLGVYDEVKILMLGRITDPS